MYALRNRTSALFILVMATVTAAIIGFGFIPKAHAIPNGDFSLEVSPSVLSAQVQPGKTATIDLKIRNAGLQPEQLKIETRAFTSSKDQKNVKLNDDTPAYLKQWVTFSQPTFEIQPRAWFTQHITVNLPENAGFSYPFAVTITRVNDPANPASGNTALKGSVAVFALINIDRPGSTRKIDLESFKSSQSVYEFVPADLELKLSNKGNSIVQPYGNIYIQRGSSDSQPISVLPVNDEGGFVLPGNTKTLNASWDQGFPHFVKATDKDGKETKHIAWNWDSISQFRIGKYTAKVIAVYNDGQRDVPIIGETTFWIFPWRILLGALVVIVFVGFGVWSVFKKILRIFHKLKRN